MKLKITPGPWNRHGLLVRDAQGRKIAHVQALLRSPLDESVANALAITALPALLGALADAADLIESIDLDATPQRRALALALEGGDA